LSPRRRMRRGGGGRLLLWHTGATQSDAAWLMAEDVDWNQHTICYSRRKLKSRGGNGIKPALIRVGEDVAAILRRRPTTGPLFPYLRTVRPGDRASEFKQRCDGLGIKGVSLHSYRYAWAYITLVSTSPFLPITLPRFDVGHLPSLRSAAGRADE
jgi:integrase